MEQITPKIIEEIMGCNLEMLHDRILVKPDNMESKSAGGIIIPDSVKERPRKGTVLFAGLENYEGKPMSVRPGDRVVYGKYAGSEMKINGIDVIVMRENDLMFIFPPDTVLDITM